MKPFCVALVALLAASFVAASACAQESGFPGVEKLMSPKAFEEAGLNKLTPEERARLNEFISSYTASTNQEAANAAVDRAVKDNKIASMPQIIESRIVGRFTGYNGRSRFQLENGQVWAQSQQVTQKYPPVDSPPVIIVKAGWGHRMYVLGGGNIRVSRMK
ncbi:MAG TPA: hypothetical protein VF551_01680 [Chthoniobacterales bacterium]